MAENLYLYMKLMKVLNIRMAYLKKEYLLSTKSLLDAQADIIFINLYILINVSTRVST